MRVPGGTCADGGRSVAGGTPLGTFGELGRGARCKVARSQSSRHAAPGILALALPVFALVAAVAKWVACMRQVCSEAASA